MARSELITPITVNLFESLEFVIFLCQIMRLPEYCEHVANLCVLTVYNADKFSPCNIFYSTQTALISNGIDSFQLKLTPFLYYVNGRSATDELDKIIDHRYQYFKRHMDDDNFDLFGRHSVNCGFAFEIVVLRLKRQFHIKLDKIASRCRAK